MLDQFIAGFEAGSIVFVALQFIAYCWMRSTPQVVTPQVFTVTPELPMSEIFKVIDFTVKEQPKKQPKAISVAAKAISEPQTVVPVEIDEMETLKARAKELKIKNVHSYKKAESLRKAIEKAKQA